VHFVGSYCVCISKCTVPKIVKYSSTLSLTSSRDKLDCQRHAPAAFPRERPDTHSIGGWVAPGSVWTGENDLALFGIRSSDCPARSKSLYRLPKEGDLATVSCFAAGREWHQAVGAIIRFVILCFLLLVTTNRLAVVL